MNFASDDDIREILELLSARLWRYNPIIVKQDQSVLSMIFSHVRSSYFVPLTCFPFLLGALCSLNQVPKVCRTADHQRTETLLSQPRSDTVIAQERSADRQASELDDES